MDGAETYNPWTIVNLVFEHLASAGLHPVLGDAGDPGAAAADLLRALGITPDKEGSRQASEQTKRQLAQIRAAVFEDTADPGGLFRARCRAGRRRAAISCPAWAGARQAGDA